MFLESILVATGVIAAAKLIGRLIGSLISRWGTRNAQPPEKIKAPLSETDKKMAEETRNVIKEKFGDNVVETLKNASNKERLDLMEDFAKTLAIKYGLDDIEVDVTLENANDCGSYNWGSKKLVFNIINIMNPDIDNFDFYVRDAIDTIIHELRHAVQHKAINTPGFWDVDEETRNKWKANTENFIRPEVDFKRYALQPIEVDARTFADEAMSEVK
jgi:hypothetical protein